MSRSGVKRLACLGILSVTLAACQAQQNASEVILSKKSPVELRAMESRGFDTTDRNKTLRTVIATLQDLGYNIDKVETAAGTVTATKLSVLHLTASVYPRGDTQTIVRANAQVRISAEAAQETQVDDPEFYQKDFFEPLSKAMFLTALQIEDKDDDSTKTKAASAAH